MALIPTIKFKAWYMTLASRCHVTMMSLFRWLLYEKVKPLDGSTFNFANFSLSSFGNFVCPTKIDIRKVFSTRPPKPKSQFLKQQLNVRTFSTRSYSEKKFLKSRPRSSTKTGSTVAGILKLIGFNYASIECFS